MPLTSRNKAKLFSATPVQRAMIAQATAHANRLQKEVFENASAFVISGLLMYGIWELSSSVPFIRELIYEWLGPLSYEKAKILLQVAKLDNPKFFERGDIFGMYERYHAALLALNAELNAIPDDVYVDMEPRLKKLATITGTQNNYVLGVFKLICQRSITNARLEADLYTLGGIIITVPVLQKLFFDLVLGKLFSRTLHHYKLKSPQKWLNRVSADEIIIELMRAHSKNKKVERIILHGIHIFSVLSIGYILNDIISNSITVPPLFVICVASCLIIALKNMALDYSHWRSVVRLQLTLEEVSKSFVIALADFGKIYLLENGATLSECYLNFIANNIDRDLSAKIVNRVVKDILVKNTIPILAYDNATITLEAQCLTLDLSLRINEQIKLCLHHHKNIRKLRKQIENFFGMHTSIMEIFLKEGDVPCALFEISRPPQLYKLDDLAKCFKGNRITITETGIEIEGNKPATIFIDYACGYKKSNYLATSDSSSSSERSGSARIMKSLALPALASSVPVPPRPVERQYWHTEIEDYDTQDGKVFPLHSKERAYVTFALPMSLFPTETCYQRFKAKVEEGRAATNGRGRQGLQVRQERVRDDTQPHRPFFLSHLRCKLLGKWGDMRVHAEKLVNENNAALYRFCSFDPANH